MTACGKEKWFNKVLKKPSSRTPGGETEKSFTKFIRDAHFSLLCLQFIWLSVQDRQHPASPGDKKVVLWVDDNPENNADEVKEGEEKHEINVTQVVSTKDAKQFLSKNGSLKGKPTRSFRVITDIYREDEGPKAAENLIKYMRDNGWTKVPILVYCSSKKKKQVITTAITYSSITNFIALLIFFLRERGWN